jgi:hypothetical protein
MRANAYIKTEESDEVLELKGYFQEGAKFNINKTTIKFASQEENQCRRIDWAPSRTKASLNTWKEQDKNLSTSLSFDFTQGKLDLSFKDIFKTTTTQTLTTSTARTSTKSMELTF